jgi:hypothetical protein
LIGEISWKEVSRYGFEREEIFERKGEIRKVKQAILFS